MPKPLTKERWRPLWFTNGKYQVSNFGRVKSVFTMSKMGAIRMTGTILKTTINHRGYETVGLCWWECGKRVEKTKKVHRLVCEAFHPNPDNKPQVNHKDLNRLNNHFRNLEWATAKENTNHAQLMGRIPIKIPYAKKGYIKGFKPVKNIHTGEVFPFVVDVVEKEGYKSIKYFWKQLRGERPNPTPYRYV